MTHLESPSRARDRLKVAALVVLLGALLLTAGIGIGALSLALLGPGLTVLLAVVAAVAYFVIRAAIR